VRAGPSNRDLPGSRGLCQNRPFLPTWSVALKRVAFCTFGCRLNQYDTEAVRTLLEDSGGFRTVGLRDEADLYVVNTCSVTARADATARKAIRRIHSERPEAKILVTGCYAQRAPEDIRALPGVALILGAADRARVAEELESLEPGQQRVAVSPITAAREFLEVPITEMMERSRAVVKVQEGCNQSCTFCIVPQTRGLSRSSRPERVLDQVRELVDSGYLEIVVTGVHVGDYGLDLAGRAGLADLLAQMLEVPGLQRLRLSSIEPASVSPELVDLMAGNEKFARHFHIPLQSASDRILQRMNRRYTAGAFRDLILRIADSVPGCGIGTDVICGFPGETDADFQETFDLLADLPIAYLHPFTYSVRPGSEAEAYGDQVVGEVKKRRTRALKRLSTDKSRAFRELHLGHTLYVLFEEGAASGAGEVSGWTDNYLRVQARVGDAGNAVTPVRVVGLTEDGLRGEALEPA
jgi:threonylcarbamoyladenosine tRNA methylthiotransferase MtaB